MVYAVDSKDPRVASGSRDEKPTSAASAAQSASRYDIVISMKRNAAAGRLTWWVTRGRE